MIPGRMTQIIPAPHHKTGTCAGIAVRVVYDTTAVAGNATKKGLMMQPLAKRRSQRQD